jgi:hypothetical protein
VEILNSGLVFYIEDISYFCMMLSVCSPSFSPTRTTIPKSLAVHLRTTWMRRAMCDPCLFHSTLFGAPAHVDSLVNASESHRTTYHGMQAVRLLRQRLHDQDARGIYETAASVLTLALFNVCTQSRHSMFLVTCPTQIDLKAS